MSTAITSRPTDTGDVATLNTREAFDLRTWLRDEGWAPVETATDFRRVRLDGGSVGRRRTVVYYPEFRSLLGGAMAWSKEGDVEAPRGAAFRETYETVAVGTNNRWGADWRVVPN